MHLSCFLHVCVSEHMRIVSRLMTLLTCGRLSDCDPQGLDNIAAISCLLLQNASDIFDIVEAGVRKARKLG